MPDEGHWLLRLTAEEWLAAARNELGRARTALSRGDLRKGLFEARRAAGMACNAILRVEPHEGWGRSYMEHLVAIADDTSVSPALRAAAKGLTAKAPASGGADAIVPLRGLSTEANAPATDAAQTFVDHAARILRGSTPAGPEHDA
jgi:HEPN domain-containing protein